MRKIKIRAWYTPFKNHNIGQEMKYGSAGTILTFAVMSPEQYKVMQYTGLKDKNGIEIYEKDILKISDYPYDEFYNDTFVVNWKEDNATYVLGENILLSKFAYYSEVIGNIYENKELLND
ncbi:hypothetical protein BG261_02920 [Floricoccus tropicus]|uniref:YopX protein domain-containing protein n=1 Tax=Floricoccus tropicus TaxID=1859473 RepID=A0A1E8GN08_9LACT|nr:YopX family protein [Floricoccus tropicus]OFI49547.1 hypothetical protein BG261_02920 [Floricoccus tropicus]